MCLQLLATASFLFILCGLPSSQAQDSCQALTYCGEFCCPNTINLLNLACCKASRTCCLPGTDDAISSTTVCGNSNCPSSLPPSEFYDANSQARDQCCKHFRSGCCSEGENETLDLLLRLAIGLGAGIGLLVFIIIFLVICCLCWFCCA